MKPKMASARLSIAALFFTLGIVGCATPPPPPLPPPPFTHHVRYSGETLGAIARWYTGNAANWRAIASHNNLDPRRIRVGTVVDIPADMVARTDPLPKSALDKLSTKPAAPAQEVPAARAAALEPPEAAVTPQFAAPAEAAGPGEASPFEFGEAPAAAGSGDLNKDLADAAMMAQLAELQSLLAKGADANAKSGDRPVLTWAAQSGQLDVVKLLIQAKADLNAVDALGQTALMRAAAMGQKDVVGELLKAGADANIRDRQERTALDIAKENDQTEIVTMLSAR